MSTRHRLAVENPSGLKYSHTNQSARQVFDALHNTVPSAAVPDVSDLDKITISIPWVPQSGNKLLRSHWTVRYKATEIAMAYIIASVQKNTIAERRRVRVTVQMYRHNPMDRDRAYAACSPIFDAVVRCGYARDDAERWMEMVVMPTKIDRKNKRCEITIERLS